MPPTAASRTPSRRGWFNEGRLGLAPSFKTRCLVRPTGPEDARHNVFGALQTPPGKCLTRRCFSSERFRLQGSLARFWPNGRPTYARACKHAPTWRGTQNTRFGRGRAGGGKAPFVPRATRRENMRSHGAQPMTVQHDHARTPKVCGQFPPPGAIHECNTCRGAQVVQPLGQKDTATSHPAPVPEPHTPVTAFAVALGQSWRRRCCPPR